jgi:hypothetical protein
MTERCVKAAVKGFFISVLILALLVSVPHTKAATQEDIELAIEKGLAWLASQQQTDGSWWFYYFEESFKDAGVTGLVVLKFVERAKELGLDPFDTNSASPTYYMYAQNVIDGFDYIFKHAVVLPGDLVYLEGLHVYHTGIAMMAMAATNAPTRLISVGSLTGWTYEEALQGMMDWMAYAQSDDSCCLGGWGYEAIDPDWADQSNTGYATLGIGFAAAAPPDGFGLTIPPELLAKLSVYIDIVQDPVDGDEYDGGSWYEPCYNLKWINILKTGNLLYEMALVGDDVSDSRVQNAIDFIENHWNSTGGHPEHWTTGVGWKDTYQAMFTMMKGFEAFGIDTIDVGSMSIDWFSEVCEVILSNQKFDGSWNQLDPMIAEGDDSQNLRTVWAMLTLEKVVPAIEMSVYMDIKPGSCPNPLNHRSKGVLPVAILGTEDFDVMTVDPATILLTRNGYEEMGVSPLRWEWEDVATPFDGELCDCHDMNGDGYMDLTLKFKIQELVQSLELDTLAGETIPLMIMGNLKEENGGTPFKGRDCVSIK